MRVLTKILGVLGKQAPGYGAIKRRGEIKRAKLARAQPAGLPPGHNFDFLSNNFPPCWVGQFHCSTMAGQIPPPAPLLFQKGRVLISRLWE